jgi:hypothetical protein
MIDWQISTLKLSAFDPALIGMEGIAYDGKQFLYVCPHASLAIAQIDTATFQVVASLDISTLIPHAGPGGPTAPAFFGASYSATDNALYLWPHSTSTVSYNFIVRVDVGNFTPSGVSYIDITNNATNAVPVTWAGNGGATDATHGYMFGNVLGPTNPLVLRVGLGNNFTAAGLTVLDCSSVLNQCAGTMWFDGKYIWVTGSYEPAGITTQQSYYVRIDPANFDLAHTVFTPYGAVGDAPVGWVDDGKSIWSVTNALDATPTYQFDKASLTVVGSWPWNPNITTRNVPWAEFGCYDGFRWAYVPSNTEAKVFVIDTQNPGSFSLIDLGTLSGCEPGALAINGFAYLCPFTGTTGPTGTMVRFKLQPPPPPGGAVASWIKISSPVTPADDEVKDTVTGVVLTDQTGLPVLADLPATVWTPQ